MLETFLALVTAHLLADFPLQTRGLLDIPGWQSMSLTQAAQAVQISAFPNAYAKWEASATAWLAQLS